MKEQTLIYFSTFEQKKINCECCRQHCILAVGLHRYAKNRRKHLALNLRAKKTEQWDAKSGSERKQMEQRDARKGGSKSAQFEVASSLYQTNLSPNPNFQY